MSKVKRVLPEGYDVSNVEPSVAMPHEIQILEPRWHDNHVLVAEFQIKQHNLVVIGHKDFPEPFFLTREEALKFPRKQMDTKKGGKVWVREIPLEELSKEVLDL